MKYSLDKKSINNLGKRKKAAKEMVGPYPEQLWNTNSSLI
jgi:hypothetical protein